MRRSEQRSERRLCRRHCSSGRGACGLRAIAPFWLGEGSEGTVEAEISVLESRGVTVEGFVTRVRQMNDGDYHIQITEALLGRCLDYDTPDQLIAELTPGIRAGQPAYTWEKISQICGSAMRVRLSGWLLFDSSRHAQDQARSTPWEVHPVTRLEWCCWRELD